VLLLWWLVPGINTVLLPLLLLHKIYKALLHRGVHGLLHVFWVHGWSRLCWHKLLLHRLLHSWIIVLLSRFLHGHAVLGCWRVQAQHGASCPQFWRVLLLYRPCRLLLPLTMALVVSLVIRCNCLLLQRMMLQHMLRPLLLMRGMRLLLLLVLLLVLLRVQEPAVAPSGTKSILHPCETYFGAIHLQSLPSYDYTHVFRIDPGKQQR
jgi:hypothetical protein